jgi:hypothetical protein
MYVNVLGRILEMQFKPPEKHKVLGRREQLSIEDRYYIELLKCLRGEGPNL